SFSSCIFLRCFKLSASVVLLSCIAFSYRPINLSFSSCNSTSCCFRLSALVVISDKPSHIEPLIDHFLHVFPRVAVSGYL
ncbi:hypothetical protein Leryth_019133, partial [Lithospermum erythrorhizon]